MKTKAAQIAAFRKAARVARPIIETAIQATIESCATPERKNRKGSVRGCTGHYFNPDTIDEAAALRDLKVYGRALALIDAALTIEKIGA